MIKTITVGSCVSVQGLFVRNLPNGKVVVRVGDKTFSGTPRRAQRFKRKARFLPGLSLFEM